MVSDRIENPSFQWFYPSENSPLKICLDTAEYSPQTHSAGPVTALHEFNSSWQSETLGEKSVPCLRGKAKGASQDIKIITLSARAWNCAALSFTQTCCLILYRIPNATRAAPSTAQTGQVSGSAQDLQEEIHCHGKVDTNHLTLYLRFPQGNPPIRKEPYSLKQSFQVFLRTFVSLVLCCGAVRRLAQGP